MPPVLTQISIAAARYAALAATNDTEARLSTLAARAQSGDATANTLLMTTLLERVRAFAERSLRAFPDIDPEDFSHEIMLKILKNLHRFDPLKGNVGSWARQIALFHLRDALEKHTWRLRQHAHESEEGNLADILSGIEHRGPPPSFRVLFRETLTQLEDAIPTLTYLERLTLYLTARGLAGSEIAKGTKNTRRATKQAISARLDNARTKLKNATRVRKRCP